MKLYVMRHGTAEDEHASGLDAYRALTAQGRERVREVAHALFDAEEAPKVVIASPLVRALQTAEIVHATLSLPTPVEVNDALSPRGPSVELVRALARKNLKRVMLVGHEPDLSMLVTHLIGDSLPTMGINKSMVVALRVPTDSPSAALRFVLEPKAMKFLYDQRRSGT